MSSGARSSSSASTTSSRRPALLQYGANVTEGARYQPEARVREAFVDPLSGDLTRLLGDFPEIDPSLWPSCDGLYYGRTRLRLYVALRSGLRLCDRAVRSPLLTPAVDLRERSL